MDLIKVRVVYISGRTGMAFDRSHDAFFPAVPRVGDYCFLPTDKQEPRRFQVSQVRWYPPLSSLLPPDHKAHVEIDLIYLPEE